MECEDGQDGARGPPRFAGRSQSAGEAHFTKKIWVLTNLSTSRIPANMRFGHNLMISLGEVGRCPIYCEPHAVMHGIISLLHTGNIQRSNNRMSPPDLVSSPPVLSLIPLHWPRRQSPFGLLFLPSHCSPSDVPVRAPFQNVFF